MNEYEKEFKRFWIKQIVKCLIFTIIICILWIVYVHNYFSERINAAVSIMIAFILCLIPVIRNKLWLLILDKSFSGKVISVKFKESQTFNKQDPRISATQPLYTIILTVKTKGNDIIKKRVQSLDPLYQDMWYHTGDEITYHRGTNFPLIVSGRRFCAYCGDVLRDDESRCSSCGKLNDE